MLIVLAVIAVVAAVAAGVVQGGMEEPTSSLPDTGLPAEGLRGSDLHDIRFSLGFRGYRMDEVDTVLDRAAAELDARDADIAQLRAELEQVRQEPTHPEAVLHEARGATVADVAQGA